MTRNWEGRIASQVDRLPPADAELLTRYDQEMRAAGLAPATRASQVSAVSLIAREIGKPLEAVEREDLVGWLADSDLAKSTKRNRLVVLRKFFKWLHGTEGPPDVVKGLKVNGGAPRNRLKPKDLLSEDEALALVKAARNRRDQALFALMWDSGARLGEILSLRVGDVDTHPRYGRALRVALRESKTDTRELALFDCRPYLAKWLAAHPTPEDPEAPLFPVFSRQPRGSPLGESGVRRALERAEERAKERGDLPAEKRVFPHLFRHSRSTDLIEKGYREPQLKKRQGWDQDTRMLSRYVHLAGEAAQEEEARIHGEGGEEEPKESAMKEKPCPVCAEDNLPTSRYCARCATPLTEEAVRDVDTTTAAILDALTKLSPEDARRFREVLEAVEGGD